MGVLFWIKPTQKEKVMEPTTVDPKIEEAIRRALRKLETIEQKKAKDDNLQKLGELVKDFKAWIKTV
jgi:hypothetical protein